MMEIVKFPFSLLMEWVCLLTSILLFKNIVPKFWRWTFFYLIITVSLESYSFLMSRLLGLRPDTQWLYNIFLMIYILFHLYIFYKLIELPYIKIICLTCLFILVGFYIYNWFNVGFLKSFTTTNTLFGGAITILSILYYYSLFQQEEPKDILKEPTFWFITGCFIFYTTSTSISAFYEEIITYSKKNSFPLRYVIMNFLNIIMYGCWIKSFICLHKAQVSSAHSS